MLNRITDYLSGRISESEYFEKIFPLVEIVSKDGTKYPAQYCGKGEYTHVNNFDNYNGLAYFRLTGKQRINKVRGDVMDMSSCSQKAELSFPLRLVACVPKSKLSKDDAFTDERISKSLLGFLIVDGGPLKDELRATSLKVFPDSVDFNNQNILSEEYYGLEKMKDVNYNFSYHAIDFTVTIEVREDCLTTECSESYYG